jgi:hypothetical protein
MSTDAKPKRQAWKVFNQRVEDLAASCQAGDEIVKNTTYFTDNARVFPKLVELLVPRRLELVAFGERFFVLPEHPHLSLLRPLVRGEADATILAMSAGTDGTVRGLLSAIFGGDYPPTLPQVLDNACRSCPRDALIPGLVKNPRHNARMRQLRAKLSKLQCEMLDYLRTQAPLGHPITPGSFSWSFDDEVNRSPAVSRAWKRLEQRGLVKRHRPNGRLIQVSLTREGRELLGC